MGRRMEAEAGGGVRRGPGGAPHRESGYALLLVFLMAAVIAISLYSEIPRVAFQSQRQKEQLLMERGLQYMRAIQVFSQVNRGQWPRNLDDIETFQNRHFLRHKYIDPMTGKNDWRVIHIQGGMLTDSLVTQNANASKPSTSTESNYISDYSGLAQSGAGEQVQRPQDRRRPSEGGAGGGVGEPLPMMPGAGPDPSEQGQAPAAPATPDNPANPVAGAPVQGIPGDASGQTPPQGGAGQPAPGMPGLPGQAGNPALNMINRMLTSPNPQAGQIVQQAQAGGLTGMGTPGTAMGGGVAGVASKSELEGIMVYGAQTLYKKWEFVFDPTKVPPIAASGGPVGSTPVTQMGQQQAQMPAGGAAGGTGAMGGGFGMSSQIGAGAQGNSGAGGSSNGPAGMQTAGSGSGALPPGFRLGRP